MKGITDQRLRRHGMDSKRLGKIQIIIGIIVLAYAVFPDLFVGPIDDSALIALGGIAEVVMTVMRKMSSQDEDLHIVN